jgi:hypothetical protein
LDDDDDVGIGCDGSIPGVSSSIISSSTSLITGGIFP